MRAHWLAGATNFDPRFLLDIEGLHSYTYQMRRQIEVVFSRCKVHSRQNLKHPCTGITKCVWNRNVHHPKRIAELKKLFVERQ
jgi:hypothetical protein